MTTTARGGSWFGPTRPTVGLEVASRRVTVAAVSGTGGRAVVTHAATETLPDGLVAPALSGQNIASRHELATAIRRVLEKAGLRAVRRVGLVVPDSVARVSLVDLEKVPNRTAELDRILRWQLRKSLPFAVTEARLSHFVAHIESGKTTLGVVLAREDVLAEYEAVMAELDIHAGIVDLASFNVANAVLGSTTSTGDSLLVNLAPDATTLLLLRQMNLMFYRHRAAAGDESVGTLVHQTAMFHVDRLGGTKFDRVWLAGGSAHPGEGGRVKAEIEKRLGVVVEPVDVGQLVTLRASRLPETDADALIAAIGVVLREARAA